MKTALKNQLSHLRQSSFIKNMLIVMSGTAFAQAFGFALTPVISRLFTPDDFGIFGSFNAVLGVIAAGVTLDYSQAIMLPKEKNDALHLFFISVIATIIITFLCIIACLVVPSSMMAVMKSPNAWALVLLVFAILITGLNVSLQSWCVRIKAFKHTSASQVIRSVSSNGMQIGFGFLQTGPIGLIISSVIADFLASINLFRVFLSDFKQSFANIKLSRLQELSKEYIDFPMYSASQNVINALSSGLPVLLLTHFFGIAVAGAYAFGLRLLATPMGLVTRALRQVLFQKASEIQHQGGSLLSLYFKVTLGLFSLGIIPTIILFVWSPQIFAFIFGSQWYEAGVYARWLILWMLFVFCNVPAVLFARLIRIQKTVFYYDLILLFARSAALCIGGIYLKALQSIVLFSAIGAIMNLLLILLVGYRIINFKAAIPDT